MEEVEIRLSPAEHRWYLAHRNVIPPTVHPLGQYWEQPPMMEIEIDDTHALVPRRIFDALKEYSLSVPTGAYEGKAWRRQVGYFVYGCWRPAVPEQWLLCWYGVSEAKGKVSINARKILVL